MMKILKMMKKMRRKKIHQASEPITGDIISQHNEINPR